MPKDKIEELFQSHLDDFDKMPDDSLWAEIEANLPPMATPVHKLWRWGLVAALLLFSLIGYVAYETFNDKPQSGLIGLKENSLKSSTDSQSKINNKGTKTTLEANRIKLTEEKENEIEALGKAKNDKESVIKNLTPNENIADNSGVGKRQKNKISISPNYASKSTALIVKKEDVKNTNQNRTIVELGFDNQIAIITGIDSQVKNNQSVIAAEGENNTQQVTAFENTERLSDVNYLANHSDITNHEIPLNTHIAYEAEYQPKEQKESFFKAPTEVYISLTPSLNYYRVFSNTMINQFNGANNGGRVGWAVQAGAVYPLKLRRFNYRVGLSYFSAQSNFRYNVVNRTQMPVRLNNNTFEYVNVEALQSESRKWQVLEIQNDLMYKVRPMQDFIVGFKAGSSFTEKPVFDAYTGYRFSRQVSNRQILWIEAAYAYAINAQKSSNNTFSYHMDKYSLRIGLNFR